VVPEGSVPRWRAPLRPSHCLARPQSERPANGPLPLICRGRLYPSGTTQPSRLPSTLPIQSFPAPTSSCPSDRASLKCTSIRAFSTINARIDAPAHLNPCIFHTFRTVSIPVPILGGNGSHFLGAPLAPGKWLSVAAPLRIEGLRCLVNIYTMAGAPRIARRLPCNPTSSRLCSDLQLYTY